MKHKRKFLIKYRLELNAKEKYSQRLIQIQNESSYEWNNVRIFFLQRKT